MDYKESDFDGLNASHLLMYFVIRENQAITALWDNTNLMKSEKWKYTLIVEFSFYFIFKHGSVFSLLYKLLYGLSDCSS